MTKLDAGVYAIFADGEAACVVFGEIAWLRLPGAAFRNLRPGFYTLDMEWIGSAIDDVLMHKEIETKCL